jgi:hypothetical protein
MANPGDRTLPLSDKVKELEQENQLLRLRNKELSDQLQVERDKIEEAIVREYGLTEEIETLMEGRHVKNLELQNKKLKRIIIELRDQLKEEQARLEFITARKIVRRRFGKK